MALREGSLALFRLKHGCWFLYRAQNILNDPKVSLLPSVYIPPNHSEPDVPVLGRCSSMQ